MDDAQRSSSANMLVEPSRLAWSVCLKLWGGRPGGLFLVGFGWLHTNYQNCVGHGDGSSIRQPAGLSFLLPLLS